MQRMLALWEGREAALDLPPAREDVMPGVVWGRFDVLFTPAYWAGQAWQDKGIGRYEPGALGQSLPEEVALCLLGGYGIPAELGMAAFERLRCLDLLRPDATREVVEAALSAPFMMDGRPRRYRFPKTKASAVVGALAALPQIDVSLGDREFRDALTALPGVGPKTASWIVRNLRSSDDVAIVDVHIARAGRLAGFFSPSWDPARHYSLMEDAFLAFAKVIGARASVLDGLMWDHMRLLGALAREDDVAMSTARKRQSMGEASTPVVPIAATPQPIRGASPGKRASTNWVPSTPNGQKPSPRLAAQRCKVARSAPASRQSRLLGFS